MGANGWISREGMIFKAKSSITPHKTQIGELSIITQWLYKYPGFYRDSSNIVALLLPSGYGFHETDDVGDDLWSVGQVQA